MSESFDQLQQMAAELKEAARQSDQPRSVLRDPRLRDAYKKISTLPEEEKAAYGQALNTLKTELQDIVDQANSTDTGRNVPIDISAPWDPDTPSERRPRLLPTEKGSQHPITQELERVLEIYYSMGFVAEESRQLDDDFHMFESLNFPTGHPARDDFDTFMTDEGLIAPAHTSTMQNRILQKYKANLDKDQAIAVVIPGRVFRNEDLDATHEHTFYQLEGVYVDKNVNVGNLIAVLQAFMSEYFNQDLKVKIQPSYFPFTEPSFELAIERPDSLRKSNAHADQWLEMLGCGMIHPNVLQHAGIDASIFSGFAWGGGIDRLVLLKHGIEDIRHMHAGKLEFLRQFS